VPTPIATWNRARGVWETEQVSLLCGHSEPFSQTWPNSGTTRAGTAYAQPMWEHLTADSGSSSSPGPEGLLPTPRPQTKGGGAQPDRTWHLRPGAGGPNLVTAVAMVTGLLPTPTTQPQTGNGHARDLGSEAKTLLPTPTASDRFGPGEHGDGGMDLRTAMTLLPTTTNSAPPAVTRPGSTTRAGSAPGVTAAPTRSGDDQEMTLLPTPRATDGTKGGPNQRGSSGDLMLPSAVMLLPTPMATDYKGSSGTERRPAGDDDLPTRVERLLPTPTAQAAKHASDDRGPGSLDDFNLWSIAARLGDRTSQPSADGSAA
jgi:hypothetical protein